MGAMPRDLAIRLRDELGLERAIETGTYQGGGARELAELFDSVATIEISEEMRREAADRLDGRPEIEMVAGDSREALPRLIDPQRPTFYWLDGHWSGGATGGHGAECPVIDEVRAIAKGHPDDCVAIDDARHFAAPPPPPHDPSQWPTLMEILDELRGAREGAHVTVVGDLVIAVPGRAKPVVDAWAQRELDPPEAPAARPASRLQRLRGALSRS